MAPQGHPQVTNPGTSSSQIVSGAARGDAPKPERCGAVARKRPRLIATGLVIWHAGRDNPRSIDRARIDLLGAKSQLRRTSLNRIMSA